MELYKAFTLEAAHYLPEAPVGHKCRRLHGHSFRVTVYVTGVVNPETGWVMDFSDIAKRFAPLHAMLDHHCLNEVSGLSNPTSEALASWIWQHLKPELPELSKIEIAETCTSGCIYQGE